MKDDNVINIDEKRLQRIRKILESCNLKELDEDEVVDIFKFVAESTNTSNLSGFLNNGKSFFVDKKAAKEIIKETDLLDATLETSFNEFYLTSKETELTKYSNELELNRLTNIVKTKDRIINQTISYSTTVKGKKVIKKENGSIVASFQSPLDWLNKRYELNIMDDNLTDREIIEKVETTNLFEVRADQELIYNAICGLLYKKTLDQNKESDIFISFNELHKQLGYKDFLRPEAKERYKGMIIGMSFLYTDINLEKAVYAGHKEYKRLHGNIDQEPLIVYKGFKRANARVNRTTKIVDGFTTDLTELMKLHFKYTKHYRAVEIEEPKRKSRLKHSEKLENYIKKLHYINTGNNNYCIDLNYKTIFDELKEFELEESYNNANRKTEFIQRQILKVITTIDEVKEAKIKDKKIRIYFSNKKP